MRASMAPPLLVAALCASCLSLEWERDARQSPPPAAAEAALEVGTTTLAEALASLGAPLQVYEYRQTGMALAYGWYRTDTKGLAFSVPVYERVSASFDYSRSREGLKGLLLLFDGDLRLASVREGWLEDLTEGFERQAPARPEDVEAAEKADATQQQERR